MLRRLLIAAFLLALILPVGQASAEGGVTVSPASTEVTLNQGDDQVEFDITLVNHDQVAVTARLTAVNFRALDESGGVAFVGLESDSIETKYGLSSWLGFSKDVVTLEPSKPETVKAIVDNRESLSPGGHYGAIVVTPVDADAEADRSRVEIVPSTAALVLVRKLGGEQYGLQLNTFSFKHAFFGLPDKADLRFQNTGNIHVVPRGTITVYAPDGKAVQKALINTDSGIIMPETFRKYQTSFNHLSKAFWPGRYRAEIAWRYDGQKDFTITEAYLWHIGWGVWLLPLLALLIGCILWITRRRKKKKVSKT